MSSSPLNCCLCHTPILAKETTVTCPQCGGLYHTECWLYVSEKCARLGCEGSTHLEAETWRDVWSYAWLGASVSGVGGALFGLVLAWAAPYSGLSWTGFVAFACVIALGAILGAALAVAWFAVNDKPDVYFARPVTFLAIGAPALVWFWPGALPWLAGLTGFVVFAVMAFTLILGIDEYFTRRGRLHGWLAGVNLVLVAAGGAYLCVQLHQCGAGAAALWLGLVGVAGGIMLGIVIAMSTKAR